MELRIGTIGVIKAGAEAGWQLRIENDEENTGGFLILTSRNFSDPVAEGYDNWVENEHALRNYFKEAGWEIQWL